MKTLTMNLGPDSYDIILASGCLSRAKELLNLDRKVLIVTDEGVPAEYAQTLAAQCKDPVVFEIPEGELTKSLATWDTLLEAMLEHDFTRKDAVAAVGGGVVGDLAGFAASAYMRGIDFYNIPTTVLAQVDSSIGGKTAVNMLGLKNIIGAFYQPKRVLIDFDLLSTLPRRQIANGLAEALKMAVCFSPGEFEIFEKDDPFEHLPEIIEASLRIKKSVVEQDEKETGLRAVLNFGHTLGHGIESQELLGGLLHGECVALGMLPMCSEDVRARLLPIYEKLSLPKAHTFDRRRALDALMHDKKAGTEGVKCVICEEIGSFAFVRMTKDELWDRLCRIPEV